jgi:hypothetical protein
MKNKLARAKKFVIDNQFAFGILVGGVAYAIAREDFNLNSITHAIPSDAPQLLIKPNHIKHLLDEDCTVLFEHPVANLILHAEPKK